MFIFERDYDWKGLIAASGPDGQSWVDVYRQESGPVNALLKASSVALRQRRLDDSQAALEEVEARRRALESAHPSLFHAIGRFYFGGLAFSYYCREQYDEAELTMIQALDSIRAALELEPSLLPFAAVSLDIPLKRARVSRARLRWQEMRGHVANLRRIVADEEPIVVLRGKTPVRHSTIAERFVARTDLAEKLLPAVHYLSDRQSREELCVNLLGQLYTSGFLIPYP